MENEKKIKDNLEALSSLEFMIEHQHNREVYFNCMSFIPNYTHKADICNRSIVRLKERWNRTLDQLKY